MARGATHYMEIVLRTAEPSGTLSPANLRLPAVQQYTSRLERVGFSTLGAHQLLSGELLTAPADRASLTDILMGLLR